MPRLPVGRFIRPRHRPTRAILPLLEGGPSQGPASRSAHVAGGLPVQLVRNISLKSRPAVAMPVSSTLAPSDGSEQSVATNGRGLVLYTTNNQDGYSVNGGGSFYPLDPSTVFPSAAGGFCCDQVVTYVPSVDRFVWVLQYLAGGGGVPFSSGPNVIRVATATSAGLLASPTSAWVYYDWTPSELGAKAPAPGTTPFLDRPRVAFTQGMLSLTAAFGYMPGNKVYGSVIWRFPLAQLGDVIHPSVAPVQARSLKEISNGGDWRWAPAQNDIFLNHQVQYFAARETTSRLNFVAWPDQGTGPVDYEVDVPSIATQNNGGPTDASPSKADWAARYTAQDGVVATGAANPLHNEVWFGWNSGRDAPKPGGGVVHVHDQPAVEFVGIDTKTIEAVDYDSIEFDVAASVNPQLSFSREGDLGVDFMFGGPSVNPTYAVGFLRPDYQAAVAVVGGAADPTGLGSSGDYLGLAADPEHNCLVAAGSAIKVTPGTASTPSSLYQDPHYVVFGRTGHCIVPPTTQTLIDVTSVTQNSNTLAVIGTISPAVSGARIQVVYTPPHGQPFSHSVISDAQGNFSDTATVGSDQAGPWSVTARWFGEGQYIGSQSNPSTVDVTPPPPPPPGQQQSTLTLSCPGGAATAFPATFAVTGSLTPAVGGSTVMVTYSPQSGSPIVHSVQTAADGSYSNSVTVNADQTYQTWTVQAHFDGDQARTPADAPSCTFFPHYP